MEDYSNYQMSLRFLAGALGVPFIPTKVGLGTDLVAKEGLSRTMREDRGLPRHKAIVTSDPFADETDHPDQTDQVVLLPALKPDVMLLHAQYVGDDGTVRIKGLTFADLEQAKAASALVVSCEQIVPRSFLRADPDQNSLPAFMVDAYVVVPYGAHPTACHYFYDYDPGYLKQYSEAARDDDRWSSYLDEWAYGVAGHEEYLEKLGAGTLTRIAASRAQGFAPGLDRR